MVDLVASVTLSLKTLLVLKQPWNTKVLSLMVVQLDLIYHRITDVVAVVVVSVVAEAVASVVVGVVTVAVAAGSEVDLPVESSLLTKARCSSTAVLRYHSE